jgi:hypothetical protein
MKNNHFGKRDLKVRWIHRYMATAVEPRKTSGEIEQRYPSLLVKSTDEKPVELCTT